MQRLSLHMRRMSFLLLSSFSFFLLSNFSWIHSLLAFASIFRIRDSSRVRKSSRASTSFSAWIFFLLLYPYAFSALERSLLTLLVHRCWTPMAAWSLHQTEKQYDEYKTRLERCSRYWWAQAIKGWPPSSITPAEQKVPVILEKTKIVYPRPHA